MSKCEIFPKKEEINKYNQLMGSVQVKMSRNSKIRQEGSTITIPTLARCFSSQSLAPRSRFSSQFDVQSLHENWILPKLWYCFRNGASNYNSTHHKQPKPVEMFDFEVFCDLILIFRYIFNEHARVQLMELPTRVNPVSRPQHKQLRRKIQQLHHFIDCIMKKSFLQINAESSQNARSKWRK